MTSWEAGSEYGDSPVLTSRPRRPIVTGTSVLGVTFDGGVMLAADTLGRHRWDRPIVDGVLITRDCPLQVRMGP